MNWDSLILQLNSFSDIIVKYQVVALWQTLILFPFLVIYYYLIKRNSFKYIKNNLLVGLFLLNILPLFHYLFSSSGFTNYLFVLFANLNNGNNFLEKIIVESENISVVISGDTISQKLFSRNNLFVLSEIIILSAILINFIIVILKQKKVVRTSQILNKDVINNYVDRKYKTLVVRYIQNDELHTPLTSGILNPAIILPKNFVDNINSTETEFVLLHELIHVKNRDTLFLTIAVFFWSISFFNPIAWIMLSLYTKYVELACDEEVLEIKNDSLNYAKALTSIACRYKEVLPVFYAAGLITSKKFLKTRVFNILNRQNIRNSRFYIILHFPAIIALLIFASILVPQGISFSVPLQADDSQSEEVYDFIKLENPPEMIEGKTALYKYLYENKLYPEKARVNGIAGMVVISFEVNQSGNTENFKIIREDPEEYGFGDAVQEALKNIKFKPGTVDGKPIRTKLQQVVRFKLD